MQQRGTDWRTILLAVGAAAGAVLAFSSLALLLVFNGFEGVRATVVGTHRTLLELVVLAAALLVIGAVFLLALYYSLLRLGGRVVPSSEPRLLKVWQASLLFLIWVAAALGAGFLVDKPVVKWITPLLYVLAIGVPVYFFVRLATGGLHPGSRQRVWGVLAAGIEMGIAPSVVAEVLLAVVAVIGLVIYVSLQPAQLATFERLARELENASDAQQVLDVMAPWLSSPLTLALALLFFSGFAPLIEETAKSLAVWSVFDQLSSPAQGFAIGALSGAAFGLVESLLVSATPDTSWTTTLLVRGTSTMMHIMAASLTGLGIGLFRSTHRWTRLFGLYLAAFALHGAWNAAVVALTFGSLHVTMSSGGVDLAGGALTLVGGVLLLALCGLIPLGMWGINLRLRTLAGPPAAVPGEGRTGAQTQGGAEEGTSVVATMLEEGGNRDTTSSAPRE